MPKSRLEPMGDHLLVADTDQATTIDGITLPDNTRQKEMLYGYVVAIGPDCTKVNVKDTVCYGPYAGKSVALSGVEFRLMREGQIEGRVVQDE